MKARRQPTSAGAERACEVVTPWDASNATGGRLEKRGGEAAGRRREVVGWRAVWWRRRFCISPRIRSRGGNAATDAPRILVSFASRNDPGDRHWGRRQRSLARTAYRNGFDRVVSWTPGKLRKTDFYTRNRAILDCPRGAGYWAWKPYLVFRALSEAPDHAVVVYWDVGRFRGDDPRRGHRFRRPIDPLLRWCDEENGGMLPGVYIPEHGPNRVWTKRDCFVLMNCDTPECWEHPQVQAAFSVWRKSDRALDLVREWMICCTDRRLVTDDPNTCGLPDHPGFRDHRHDQSVLTNLVWKRGLRCYGSPGQSQPDSKNLDALVARIGREWAGGTRSLREEG
jgi:hypothetical protein